MTTRNLVSKRRVVSILVSKLCFHLHIERRSLLFVSFALVQGVAFVGICFSASPFPGLARILGEQGAKVVFSAWLALLFPPSSFPLYKWGFSTEYCT